MAASTPTFSIVIPTHNESDDIDRALQSLMAQTVAPEEIIVVDDASSDDTRERLGAWALEGRIRLIEHTENRGAAAARNTGIDTARGDVVVFVDADNVVPPEFLERLASKYAAGADLISVESRVANRARIVGRFQQAMHELQYGGLKNSGYTQCFSCRRELAVATRFPEELPSCGGDDVEFFDRLMSVPLRWEREASIVVDHTAPDTFSSFWRQSITRGKAVPFIERRLKSLPLPTIVARRAAAGARSLVAVALFAPGISASVRLARSSDRRWRDLPAFWLLWHAGVVARRLGEWRGIAALRREEQTLRCA